MHASVSSFPGVAEEIRPVTPAAAAPVPVAVGGSPPADGKRRQNRHDLQPITFGSCIASVCGACGPARAEGLLRFAVNANIVAFPGRRHVEIAPRDLRMVGKLNRHDVTGLIRYFLRDDRQRGSTTPDGARVG